MELKETFQKVKAASKTLGLLTDEQRNKILQAVADAIIAETPALLAANAEDLAKMDKANPLCERQQVVEQGRQVHGRAACRARGRNAGGAGAERKGEPALRAIATHRAETPGDRKSDE